MGPGKNQELYAAVAKDIEPILDDEFTRRNLVGPVLSELTILFDERDNTRRPMVEPTLFARLYAVSLVQRSRMGISGFNPLEAFNYGNAVEAKAAPYHDEFKSQMNNATYRTRVINLLLPDQSLDKDIRIFGLNFYQPGPTEDVEPVAPERTPTISGLIVTDNRGRVTSKDRTPVTGETVVFAVHNRTSKDAKLYQVSFISPERADLTFEREAVVFETGTRAKVCLPDKQVVTVEQLQDELLQQAVDELDKSVERLKGLANPDTLLTTEERQAARSVALNSDTI